MKQGDIAYTYDRDGNLLSEKGLRREAEYEYNGQNRMIYSRVSNTVERSRVTSRYAYDALGRRTIEQDEGSSPVRTLYDGLSFEAVRSGVTFNDGRFTTRHSEGIQRPADGESGGMRYRWISGEGSDVRTRSAGGEYGNGAVRYTGISVTLYGRGEAVAVSRSASEGSRGGPAYLGKDLLGSVMTATNEYGVLEDRYEYDAFGQPYAGDLESGMNLGYTGKPYDSATGLYNFGYRDYQPVAARFTTVDPIRDGSNWFAYVNNDPVNWIDLWGLSTSDVRNENNILQHTNLSGLERTKAEISDIFGVSFTMGINAGASIKVGGILAIDVGVDLGSNTVTQDKNGLNSIDTIGIDASLNILNFGDIGLQGSKVAPASSSDSFLDHVINAWTNGTSTIAANGNINIKGANLAANGNNLILGVGAQLGVGMEVWVNISESIDAIHYGIQSLQDHIMGKK